jgi:septum formation protein
MDGRERELPIILASTSPRRRELLKQLDIRVEVIASHAEERPLEGETPEEHVIRLAEEKAGNVATRYPGRWIIGADTIVLIDGEILGKPRNRKEAEVMLTCLSGKVHRVYTGFCVISPDGQRKIGEAVMTEVLIKELSRREIEGYVRTGEPMDKAGGYAIQGIGGGLVKEIRGSYSNVVGLPLCELVEILSGMGAYELFEGQ